MSFDVENAIWSAVISTVVSLGVVTWRTDREENAKRRHAARVELRRVVDQMLDQVRRQDLELVDPRSRDSLAWPTDWAWGSEVIRAAKPLSTRRRHRVRRRLEGLLGPILTLIAELHPAENSVEAMSINNRVHPQPEVFIREAPYFLDEALHTVGGSRALKDLQRRLRGLARRWW